MNGNTSNIKVSVMVAVYNTSKYLRKCLDSLDMQSMQEIEFIVVDDGSTDGSGVICDEYARRNPKFKVIHQQHSGLAAARQTGMDNAKGEYVIVCDSDDWVEPEMYETLYNVAAESNADIAICGYWNEYPDRICPTIMEKERLAADASFLIIPGGWCKLIKHSFFVNSNIKYEPGIDMGEDKLVNYKLFRFNPSVVYIPVALYHYRRRIGEDSYTNNIKTEYVSQQYYVYRWFKENYTEDIYSSYILSDALSTLSVCALSEKPDKVFFAQFLKKELGWKMLFRHFKYRKAKFLILLKPLPVMFQICLIRACARFFL